MFLKWFLSLVRKSEGSASELGGRGLKNSPGKRRVVP